MFTRNKVFYLFFAVVLSAFIMTGCGTSAENGKTAENTTKEAGAKTGYAASVKENPIVIITTENDQKIVLVPFFGA